MLILSLKSLIKGIEYYVHGDSTFLVCSGQSLRVLSSAVLGGELRWTRFIINHTVDKNYSSNNPAFELMKVARTLRLEQDVVGMMTAVSITHTVLNWGKAGDLLVAALCRLGEAQPVIADNPSWSPQ